MRVRLPPRPAQGVSPAQTRPSPCGSDGAASASAGSPGPWRSCSARSSWQGTAEGKGEDEDDWGGSLEGTQAEDGARAGPGATEGEGEGAERSSLGATEDEGEPSSSRGLGLVLCEGGSRVEHEYSAGSRSQASDETDSSSGNGAWAADQRGAGGGQGGGGQGGPAAAHGGCPRACTPTAAAQCAAAGTAPGGTRLGQVAVAPPTPAHFVDLPLAPSFAKFGVYVTVSAQHGPLLGVLRGRPAAAHVALTDLHAAPGAPAVPARLTVRSNGHGRSCYALLGLKPWLAARGAVPGDALRLVLKEGAVLGVTLVKGGTGSATGAGSAGAGPPSRAVAAAAPWKAGLARGRLRRSLASSVDLHISGPCLSAGVLYAPPLLEFGPLGTLIAAAGSGSGTVPLPLAIRGDPGGRQVPAQLRRVRSRWMLLGAGPWLRESGAEEGDCLRLSERRDGGPGLLASLRRGGAETGESGSDGEGEGYQVGMEKHITYAPTPAAKTLLRRLVAGGGSDAVPLILTVMDEPHRRTHRIRAELRRAEGSGRAFTLHGIGPWLRRRGARPGDLVGLDAMPNGSDSELGLALIRQDESDDEEKRAPCTNAGGQRPSPATAAAAVPTPRRAAARQGTSPPLACVAGALGEGETEVARQILGAHMCRCSQIVPPVAVSKGVLGAYLDGHDVAELTLLASAPSYSAAGALDEQLPATFHRYGRKIRMTGLRRWLRLAGGRPGDALVWSVRDGRLCVTLESCGGPFGAKARAERRHGAAGMAAAGAGAEAAGGANAERRCRGGAGGEDGEDGEDGEERGGQHDGAEEELSGEDEGASGDSGSGGGGVLGGASASTSSGEHSGSSGAGPDFATASAGLSDEGRSETDTGGTEADSQAHAAAVPSHEHRFTAAAAHSSAHALVTPSGLRNETLTIPQALVRGDLLRSLSTTSLTYITCVVLDGGPSGPRRLPACVRHHPQNHQTQLRGLGGWLSEQGAAAGDRVQIVVLTARPGQVELGLQLVPGPAQAQAQTGPRRGPAATRGPTAARAAAPRVSSRSKCEAPGPLAPNGSHPAGARSLVSYTDAVLHGSCIRLSGQQVQLLFPELVTAPCGGATSAVTAFSVVLTWQPPYGGYAGPSHARCNGCGAEGCSGECGGGGGSAAGATCEATATLILFRPERGEWRLSLSKDNAEFLGGGRDGGGSGPSTGVRLRAVSRARVGLEVLRKEAATDAGRANVGSGAGAVMRPRCGGACALRPAQAASASPTARAHALRGAQPAAATGPGRPAALARPQRSNPRAAAPDGGRCLAAVAAAAAASAPPSRAPSPAGAPGRPADQTMVVLPFLPSTLRRERFDIPAALESSLLSLLHRPGPCAAPLRVAVAGEPGRSLDVTLRRQGRGARLALFGLVGFAAERGAVPRRHVLVLRRLAGGGLSAALEMAGADVRPGEQPTGVGGGESSGAGESTRGAGSVAEAGELEMESGQSRGRSGLLAAAGEGSGAEEGTSGGSAEGTDGGGPGPALASNSINSSGPKVTDGSPSQSESESKSADSQPAPTTSGDDGPVSEDFGPGGVHPQTATMHLTAAMAVRSEHHLSPAAAALLVQGLAFGTDRRAQLTVLAQGSIGQPHLPLALTVRQSHVSCRAPLRYGARRMRYGVRRMRHGDRRVRYDLLGLAAWLRARGARAGDAVVWERVASGGVGCVRVSLLRGSAADDGADGQTAASPSRGEGPVPAVPEGGVAVLDNSSSSSSSDGEHAASEATDRAEATAGAEARGATSPRGRHTPTQETASAGRAAGQSAGTAGAGGTAGGLASPTGGCRLAGGSASGNARKRCAAAVGGAPPTPSGAAGGSGFREHGVRTGRDGVRSSLAGPLHDATRGKPISKRAIPGAGLSGAEASEERSTGAAAAGRPHGAPRVERYRSLAEIYALESPAESRGGPKARTSGLGGGEAAGPPAAPLAPGGREPSSKRRRRRQSS
ncbi:hypothetical protein HYH03_006410 [Edaphochlamys debaryana]|uniref:Uncharacterized protein n=1 Tax=Edaphochlamys debaryana TaxID=47281 RepID=A0A835Y3Q1_9CHLO|nr:hypothetical protein HYH03_006410 [Edaphochlamys debaryana]|eukprot:KAG2495465.1 hypothetical protein HYH03_006410 [Edaphochlamys debaryana]